MAKFWTKAYLCHIFCFLLGPDMTLMASITRFYYTIPV